MVRLVLLIHQSGTQAVTNFTEGFPSGFANFKIVNISEQYQENNVKDRNWLDKENRFVLFCFTTNDEDTSNFERIIREKDYLQPGSQPGTNRLHEKVFSVSFGKRSDAWPPEGIQRSPGREFFFSLDVGKRKAPDFENSCSMLSLTSAIAGINNRRKNDS